MSNFFINWGVLLYLNAHFLWNLFESSRDQVTDIVGVNPHKYGHIYAVISEIYCCLTPWQIFTSSTIIVIFWVKICARFSGIFRVSLCRSKNTNTNRTKSRTWKKLYLEIVCPVRARKHDRLTQCQYNVTGWVSCLVSSAWYFSSGSTSAVLTYHVTRKSNCVNITTPIRKQPWKQSAGVQILALIMWLFDEFRVRLHDESRDLMESNTM